MNRQRGMSSLLLVVLLLVIGSLMLQGSRLQYQTLRTQVIFEHHALRESAQADSLLQWGKMMDWRPVADVQCTEENTLSGRICLRRFDDASVLLIAVSGSQTRWQAGRISTGRVQFNARGWSDFCPRKEVSQCQIP